MEVTAYLNNYRQSPRKVRLVTELLRGQSVSVALVTLDTTVKRASASLKKLLLSAVANAEHNHKLDKARLFVKKISVDQGQILKRSMPRARGSAFPIHKHTSRISLVLADREPKEALSTKSEVRNKIRKENV